MLQSQFAPVLFGHEHRAEKIVCGRRAALLGERMDILANIHDGFRIAEEDLAIRGPGDYLGIRQSGLPDLRVASINDTNTRDLARREAIRILEADPDLSSDDHQGLSARFRQYSEMSSGEIS